VKNQATRGPSTRRPAAFARHSQTALEKHVPEARTASAHWSIGANEAWVRFLRADGLHGYVGLRRHLDWVTGEVGVSRRPCDLRELFPLPGTPAGDVAGYRIRLGHLLEGEDRWWSAGESERELVERLDDLALQLAVKGGAFFRRWPGGDT
jgi:hypothetical protein